MEQYREQKDPHKVFIDLEKAYNKIPMNIMWWALNKHKVPKKYVRLCQGPGIPDSPDLGYVARSRRPSSPVGVMPP